MYLINQYYKTNLKHFIIYAHIHLIYSFHQPVLKVDDIAVKTEITFVHR